MELFLASQSPRRAEILEDHDVHFTVVPNLLEQEPEIDSSTDIPEQVISLAELKARHSAADHDGIVLGVDTVVVFKGRVLGKPRSIEDAIEMLHMLSGYSHSVYSAFALYHRDAKKVVTGIDRSVVEFYALSDDMIHNYVTDYEVLDKAGSYGIQDVKEDFVSSLKGSYYNVMGLPIEVLLPALEKYDIVELSQ